VRRQGCREHNKYFHKERAVLARVLVLRHALVGQLDDCPGLGDSGPLDSKYVSVQMLASRRGGGHGLNNKQLRQDSTEAHLKHKGTKTPSRSLP
jgi:hypothetical protein